MFHTRYRKAVRLRQTAVKAAGTAALVCRTAKFSVASIRQNQSPRRSIPAGGYQSFAIIQPVGSWVKRSMKLGKQSTSPVRANDKITVLKQGVYVMKSVTRRIIFTAMALLVVILIAGCAKFKDLGVYDKSVPVDQLCTLEVSAGLYVRQFDDKKVGPARIFAPKASGWGLITNDAEGYAAVKIPAGSHALTANFIWGEYSTSYEVKDLNITHDFTAGRTYRLTAVFFDRNGDVVPNIGSASTVQLAIVEGRQ